MLKTFMQTEDHIAGLILRVTLGIVMFPHGAQKALGWFGGGGISGTIQAFEQFFGLPAVITILVIATEFLGSLALIAGVATRLAALAIGIEMLVAVFMVHLQNGFFMNWFGNQQGEGFEYHLLVIGIVLVLTIMGGGTASVDRKLTAGASAPAM